MLGDFLHRISMLCFGVRFASTSSTLQWWLSAHTIVSNEQSRYYVFNNCDANNSKVWQISVCTTTEWLVYSWKHWAVIQKTVWIFWKAAAECCVFKHAGRFAQFSDTTKEKVHWNTSVSSDSCWKKKQDFDKRTVLSAEFILITTQSSTFRQAPVSEFNNSF